MADLTAPSVDTSLLSYRHQLSSRLPATGSIKTEAEAREAAKEFEAVYLQTVLADIIPEPKENFFGGGSHGEKLWHSLLNEEYAKILSHSGGFGIADAVYKELINLQEGNQNNE